EEPGMQQLCAPLNGWGYPNLSSSCGCKPGGRVTKLMKIWSIWMKLRWKERENSIDEAVDVLASIDFRDRSEAWR
ncbi:MAG: hypothetical protein ACREP9_10460, partial [Candidatus Dormibacteraceae bacterium]